MVCHGWLNSATTLLGEPLKQIELKLKEWDDDSVEMEVSHCGICGSDIHTLDSDWSATKYPICGKCVKQYYVYQHCCLNNMSSQQWAMKSSVRLLVLVRMSPTWLLETELVLVLNLLLAVSALIVRRAWKMSALVAVLALTTAPGSVAPLAVVAIPTVGGNIQSACTLEQTSNNRSIQ